MMQISGKKSIILLPSPQMGNNDGAVATVQVITMMNGDRHTFIKPKRGRRRSRWEFQVNKTKAQELEQFCSDEDVVTVSWRGDIRRGNLMMNPVEYNGQVGESYRVVLEFEEEV